jgi:hypothetical protein
VAATEEVVNKFDFGTDWVELEQIVGVS